MKTVLCYGDSNTWGYIGGTGERFAPEVRWPGVLQAALGGAYRVIEEGLNGRTTVFDDSIEEGRNGETYLRPCLQTHAPIDLVILMLGTNDLKRRFSLSRNRSVPASPSPQSSRSRTCTASTRKFSDNKRRRGS